MNPTSGLQLTFNTTMGHGDPKRIITDTDILVFVAYAIIALTSIFANGVTIFIIIRNTEFHTLYNYLLLNLAVADFISGIFSIIKEVSIVVVAKHKTFENFSDITCKCFTAIIYINVCVSVNTLTVIAFERYYGITQPIAHKLINTKSFRYLIALVWIWSVIVAGFFGQELEMEKESFYCGLQTDDTYWPMWKLVSGWLFLVLGFLFAIFVTSVLYSKVIRYFLVMEKSTQNTSVSLDRQARRLRNKKSFKIVKLLIMITVLFTLAIIPEVVYFALVLYDRRFVNSALFYKIGIPTVAIIAINPFVYTLSNPSYRTKIKRLCSFC